MWKLVIEDDEGKRTVVPLTRDDYTIGRQEGNTIRLTERNVSREHGRIKRKRNGAASPPPAPPSPAGTNGAAKDNFVLEDRSSYNGLFVNGLRVAHTQDLQHGDLIQIGDYRIVLQDDAASSIETAAIPITTAELGHDVKATIPMAAAFRGQDLTDRPSRFVMLVGPTPGVEYPLERERMTIGRAEDASISVNHNSVSRLHCEVHALGDGRYEIVDKGSSNGVRVNAVELKRSIIEAGDVIELGDVRFKFVGAGQVFVPGPNESQQLTAISDREAELADPRRKGWGGYALPIVGAGLVGALIILAVVWVLRARATETPPGANITTTPDTDQALVAEAKKSCTPDDCDAAYQQISTLSDKSPWRSHKDFRDIENMWADSMFKKAAAATDITVKRAMLAKVGAATTLDEAHRTKLAAALADLDQPAATPSQLPIASATPPATAAVATTAAIAPTPSAGRTATAHPATTAPPTATTATPAVTTTPTVKPPSGASVLDKAIEASKDGRSADVRRLLENKVRGGHASSDEVRLVVAACKNPYDKACLDDIKARYNP